MVIHLLYDGRTFKSRKLEAIPCYCDFVLVPLTWGQEGPVFLLLHGLHTSQN
jgi:hypothetical protein